MTTETAKRCDPCIMEEHFWCHAGRVVPPGPCECSDPECIEMRKKAQEERDEITSQSD